MRTHTGRKLAVAVATTLALCFALSAAPAPAAGPFNIEVTGGTLTAAGNAFDLTPGSGGTPPCPGPLDPPKVSTLAFRTDTPAAGQWTVTGMFSTFFQLGTPPAGPWYQADITINALGTYTAKAPPNPPDYNLATIAGANPPNPPNSPHLTFQARIYEIGTGDCAKDASNLKCIIAGRTAGTGTYTGTLPNAAVNDTALLNVNSQPSPPGLNMVTSSCAAPFNMWGGQPVSIANLGMKVIP